jgi:hypothetical protein
MKPVVLGMGNRILDTIVAFGQTRHNMMLAAQLDHGYRAAAHSTIRVSLNVSSIAVYKE